MGGLTENPMPRPIVVLISLLIISSIAWAQTAPAMGTAESFAVLGASTVTNTGATSVTGDVGVSPGSAITGFPPGVVTGALHAGDAAAAQAQLDAAAAYNVLIAEVCPPRQQLDGPGPRGIDATARSLLF